MNEATRRRHLPTGRGEVGLWHDRFDQADAFGRQGWRTVGAPASRPVRIEMRPGLEVTAPPTAPGECGLQRDLEAVLLRGRSVRLRLDLACPSARRLEALRGVRLSVDVVDGDGRRHEVFLPIAADLTPGWETLQWWLRFGPQVASALLRVRLMEPGAGIVLGDLEMTAHDRPVASGETAGPSTTQPAGARVNLIAGGDFETHRRIFYASTIRQWPNGDETASVLPFEMDNEAVVAERSLRLRIGEGAGRLGFGPLDLSSTLPSALRLRLEESAQTEGTTGGPAFRERIIWYLKFFARANRQTNVTTSLRVRTHPLGRTSFAVGPEWQMFTATFDVAAASPEDALMLA
ncbi:MAG: hypothetical protein HY718_08460, partial [Planctomycetes bacterium]|nr:hypothetical protein [Planctomycetota bacterium]